jgi:drug/metabolite transporter (DMT)-like permease
MAVVTSPTIPDGSDRVDPRLIFSLAAVYLIWGSTYLAMAFVVTEIPPFLQGSMRFSFAGLVMLMIAMKRGVPFPPLRDWLRIAPIGALMFVGGNAFVAIGTQTVTSGGAAIVCAMLPLWVGVLGILNKERPTRREWVSLLGFAGVIVLMGGPSLAGKPEHVAILLCAPISWSIGSVLQRRLPANTTTNDTFMLPAVQMLCGGAMLGLLGALSGERISTDTSTNAWLGLAYLAIAGSLIAFTAYSWMLRHSRPAIATSYAYVNPIIAVLAGVIISGEPLGATTFIANAMIVIAVMLVLRNGAKRQVRRG